ncbi:unnamed protein product [Discosporangium mesarthrocarpum]
MEAEYFYKRKFSVVNGMHTVLAFMTLRQYQPDAIECNDFTLMSYESASDPLKKEIWAWVTVRCLILLDKYGVDTLKGAHGVETEKEVFDCLLDYGRQTMARFSSIVDSTSR